VERSLYPHKNRGFSDPFYPPHRRVWSLAIRHSVVRIFDIVAVEMIFSVSRTESFFLDLWSRTPAPPIVGGGGGWVGVKQPKKKNNQNQKKQTKKKNAAVRSTYHGSFFRLSDVTVAGADGLISGESLTFPMVESSSPLLLF